MGRKVTIRVAATVLALGSLAAAQLKPLPGNLANCRSHEPAVARHQPASDGVLPDAPRPQTERESGIRESEIKVPGTQLNLQHSSGPQPDGACYEPLAAQQKFKVFLRRTYSPFTMAGELFDAGYSQLTRDWPAYGQGMEGFGKRVGATVADAESRTFFQTFLFPSLLHQDPRYFYDPNAGLLDRAFYAATRVIVTRDDYGQSTLNSSKILGTIVSKSLSNAYYPAGDRGLGRTANRVFGALLSDAGSNVLREFWPDVRRKLRRVEPRKIRELQQGFERRTGTQVGDLLAP